jgi:hypothetical protein
VVEHIPVGRTKSSVSLACVVHTLCPDSRRFGTYANYLSHVRAVCYAADFEAPPVGHPCIARAMKAIAKRQMFKSKEGKHIQK